MKKRFLKNRYHLLVAVLSGLFLVFVMIIDLIFANNIDVFLLLVFVFIGYELSILIFGFYFYFQFIEFDENGIHVYVLRKEIKFIKWKQINEIKDSCDEFKGPLVYRIKYDNGKELVIEKRKKINEALNYYLNKKRLDIIYKNY